MILNMGSYTSTRVNKIYINMGTSTLESVGFLSSYTCYQESISLGHEETEYLEFSRNFPHRKQNCEIL